MTRATPHPAPALKEGYQALAAGDAAAAEMAARFDAAVVYGYIRRGRDGSHRVSIEGPLELVRTGDREQDVIANTAMLTKRIETTILQEPEQWVWMHRRWRRRP